MKRLFFPLAAAAFIVSFSATAQAGALTEGQWTASRCGPKPAVAALDLSDPDAYNKSVGAVDTYRRSIRTYLDCLVQEGNADIQSISNAIKLEQQAAATANEKILTDVKAADAKFEGGGK
ncbi:MAG: hypothetical protein Q7J47_02305 [Azoarcus sp.]|nr:hypothetical protein [Azoarcus sp.]